MLRLQPAARKTYQYEECNLDSFGGVPLIFALCAGQMVGNFEFRTWTLLFEEHLQMKLAIVWPRGLYDLLVLVDEGGETLHHMLQTHTPGVECGVGHLTSTISHLSWL